MDDNIDKLTRVFEVLGRMESLEVAAGPLPGIPAREDYAVMNDLITEAMNIIGDPRSLRSSRKEDS